MFLEFDKASFIQPVFTYEIYLSARTNTRAQPALHKLTYCIYNHKNKLKYSRSQGFAATPVFYKFYNKDK